LKKNSFLKFDDYCFSVIEEFSIAHLIKFDEF